MENKRGRALYTAILVGVFAAIVGIFLAVQAVPLASATSTNALTANVVVSSACYALGSPNPLSFGSVSPGTSTYTNTLATDNDVGGNAAAYFYIKSGGDLTWLSNTILIGNVLWNAASQGSYTGTALTTSFANTAISVAAPSISTSTTTSNVYFGIKVPNGASNGVYSQTMTFNNLCTSSSTNVITANVLVPATCMTSASATSITFGTMSPGTTYNTNVLVTDSDNGGNVQATIWVEGTDWTYLSNTINVANTLWNSATQGSYTGNAMTSSYASTGITIAAPTLSSNTSSNIYFGMNVVGGAPSGTYTQTITLENSC